MRLQAFGSSVVLIPFEPAEKLGGIVLPETKREQIRQRPMGVVVEVGPNVNMGRGDDERIEEDQVLIYDKPNSRWIHGQDGQLYILCDAGSILARVLSDEHATPDQMRAMRERHEKIMREETEAVARQNAAAQLAASANMIPPRLVQE